ncbi:neurotrypsin-like [Mytilus californianus]|uniref:neurotrypsin-like n=1 Tax=Mytilus californianus TaxID=6549 RepID=UPI00224792C2|nr:neurotrypsin-like [Mytilus californianus]
MADLTCTGAEKDVSVCQSIGWGSHNCGQRDDVGVECPTPVRLVGGTKPSKGRLEVYHSGSWGSVCDDNFDLKDAAVVCRTLGFMTSHPSVYPGGHFGHSTLSSKMVDLNCTGAEKDVSACQSTGWGSHNCGQRDDVGVECQTGVRLVNGPSPSRGRVEIMYRGQWGTICDDRFGQEEAVVVCRMLGYHNS